MRLYKFEMNTFHYHEPPNVYLNQDKKHYNFSLRSRFSQLLKNNKAIFLLKTKYFNNIVRHRNRK